MCGNKKISDRLIRRISSRKLLHQLLDLQLTNLLKAVHMPCSRYPKNLYILENLVE